jgi:hypothetical protein
MAIESSAPVYVRISGFLRLHSWLLFFLLTAIASVRIISTYTVFSFTSDEPVHVAAGMEWLDKGTYTYNPENPPLARVMTAIGPFLTGSRSRNLAGMWREGWAILNAPGDYKGRLALARLGILPFFWLTSLVMYLWTKRYLGEPMALVATFFLTMLPPILAHAGLATTDIALTGTFGAAFYTMLVWLERPSIGTAIWFGVAVAAAALTKFSALAFLTTTTVSALVAYLCIERPPLGKLLQLLKSRLITLAISALVVLVLVWAGYRFSFSHIPAPNLFAGITQLREHNAQGHRSYLLGQISDSGFWLFYPVAIGVKTPLALLVLAVVGTAACLVRRRSNCACWIPFAVAAGVLAVGFYSRINIGIRHVLPIYYPICMLAAFGTHRMLSARRPFYRWAAAGLILWMVLSSALAHPDYLSYFNELAGRHPERILVDSDLDWGQDMYRVAAKLKEVGATQVAVDPILVQNPQTLHDFPPLVPLNPDAPVPGWNAVSMTLLKERTGMFADYPRAKPWAEQLPPTIRVGRTWLLWYVPGPEGQPRQTPGK